MKSQHFRANVGLVLVTPEGLVLAFERSDARGSWQLPQGGLDVGEEPLDAALRELHEETGIVAEGVTLLGVHPDWIAYEWPLALRGDGPRRGQVQRWHAFALGPAARVDLSASDEFAAWKAVPFAELLELVHPMRRRVYARLAEWLEGLDGGPRQRRASRTSSG